MRIRVKILTASPALRAGLASLLSELDDIEVLGGTDSRTESDVFIVADDGDQGELVTQLGEMIPAVLLLSEDVEAASTLASLPLAAWGLLPPDCSEEELLAAVRALHQGLVVATPDLLRASLEALPAALDENQLLVEELTERELEVLQLLAEGLANKQIALELRISEHTVKFHSSAIYGKLGVTNRTEALRQALRLGLISI